MKIGICLKETAYLPEAYAYSDYLTSKGFNIELGFEKDLSSNLDLKLKFLGFSLFIPKNFTKLSIPEIHEYGSLSIPPFSKFKDKVKCVMNSKPVGRIFLNDTVKKRLTFNDNKPFILRDMGIDKSFYNSPNNNPEYDVVYCGSEREGLLNAVRKIINSGLKILIIGNYTKEFISCFSNNNMITFTGKIEREELPELYKKCRLGLNFTPDKYPFNIQTSTKTIEYCAAGLGIISNKYYWIEEFMATRQATFFNIDQLTSKKNIINFNFIIPDVKDLEWNNILDRASLVTFLTSLL